jgi:hypothetical protein
MLPVVWRIGLGIKDERAARDLLVFRAVSDYPEERQLADPQLF